MILTHWPSESHGNIYSGFEVAYYDAVVVVNELDCCLEATVLVFVFIHTQVYLSKSLAFSERMTVELVLEDEIYEDRRQLILISLVKLILK